MRNLILFFLISINVFACSSHSDVTKASASNSGAQNAPYEYDPDFPEYILAQWSNKDYDKAELPKFDMIRTYYEHFKPKDESVLSNEVMSKPSIDNLLYHYLNTKLQWNSFNMIGQKVSEKEVVERELNNLPSEDEMLAHYYGPIFIHLLNNQRNIEPFETDLDFEELGLDKKEGAIMFLCAMRHMGGQVASYSNARFPDNCFRAFDFVKKMPTFNGKSFETFELPEFEDFVIDLDVRHPKSSFKARYLPEFQNAKAGYLKCLANDQKN